MRKSSMLARSSAIAVLLGTLGSTAPAHLRADADPTTKFGPLARGRAALAVGSSRVIVRAVDPGSLPQLGPIIQQAGGDVGRQLPIINGQVARIPNAALKGLANNPLIERISLDRPVAGAMERTGATIGATAVREDLGYDGTGIGVAIIDSGVTPSHDDLACTSGVQRVERFVDFVNGRETAYDDYGHGTHVAGIIAGSGVDSDGARSGIAPGAHLIVLKALDEAGNGHISDVIAALDYVLANKDEFNIRVVNLSVSAGVYDSYNSDPLTLAARSVVAAGVVVVAAAGNAGSDPQGVTEYAGITAPANAPWVLTVGASSHMGTVDRADDTMAAFSSRGPTAVDAAAKPDLVAPGVGIESLSAPESAFYTTMSSYLISGTVTTPFVPYLSLSGTSMAAPVVAGSIALLLQANPALTPNEIKAILQYTSQRYPAYDELTEGAGFLNVKGAVDLARYFADPAHLAYPGSSGWSARIIWGNELLTGGRLTHDANAWSSDVAWGSAVTPSGESVTWGEICSTADCLAGTGPSTPWTTICSDGSCSTVTWGAGGSQNIVWGSTCGGADCTGPWSPTIAGTLIFQGVTTDTVVWGSSDADTVVWGSSDGDTVVWGSTCSGTTCQPVIWNKP